MEVLLCQCVNEPSCDRHPLRVRENAAFLVNVDSYNNWEDIKDDMNGAYTKPLTCGTWTFECQKNDNGETDIKLVARKALPLMKNSQYHLLINSKANKACPSLVRSIFLMKDSSHTIVNGMALLQYHITSGEEQVDFHVGVHGNSSKFSKAAFYPTAKSTLEALKQKVGNNAPSQVYKAVYDKAGGSSQARTPGTLPRSRKQVYDLQFRANKENDPVEDLLVYARMKDDTVVLRHEDLPNDLWVLGTKVMCNDLG